MEVLFISEKFLKDTVGIDGNVDFKKLESTIVMVQDVYIQPILGTSLFNDLKTKLSADDTLASYPNENELLDKYISKCLAWYIKAEASYYFKFAYQNKGVQVKNSTNSNAADTNDLQLIKDDCVMKAKAYASILTNYLVANSNLYPKYLEGVTGGISASSNNFLNGIYVKH